MQAQLPPPAARMFGMITGFWTSCSIYVAAQLNIADLLSGGPKTADRLAEETKTHAPSLYRLLRTLSSLDIFKENEKNEFELTELGNTLRSDVTGSLKYHVIMNLRYHYSAWGNLLSAVTTGETAFNHLHQQSVWEYYENDEEGIRNFNRAMNGVTQMVIPHILAAYDFKPFSTIMDIGGGDGLLLSAILKSAPGSKGIVMDLPHAKEQALTTIGSNHLTDRCQFVEGSFFETIPTGMSLYLMKSVLHDWNDQDSIKILQNIREAMPAGGKLLLIEYLIPERNLPHPSKLMDINMLVMTGGKGRTAREWKQLVEDAGLQFSKIIATTSPMFPIIEAEKV